MYHVVFFRAFSGVFLHLCCHVGRNHLDPNTAQVLHHPLIILIVLIFIIMFILLHNIITIPDPYYV